MAIVNFDAIIPKFCSEFPNPICNFSLFSFFKVFNLFFMNIFWSQILQLGFLDFVVDLPYAASTPGLFLHFC